MRHLLLPLVLLPAAVVTPGCSALEEAVRAAGAGGDPTLEEIAGGLRQALTKGALHAAAELGQEGGYLSDAAVRIPFPEDARFAADALRSVGLGSLVDGLVERLNRGAEAGAERAAPIFEQAIRSMGFADVEQVLLGGEHAATDYFRATTYDALVAEFRPEVERALADVGALGIWSRVSSEVNRLPFLTREIETDLAGYATERALDGLFLKLQEEEARIRADPVARTTELLRRVFSYAARRRADPPGR